MQIDQERKRATAPVESISLSMETVKQSFQSQDLYKTPSLVGSQEKVTKFLTNDAIQVGSG